MIPLGCRRIRPNTLAGKSGMRVGLTAAGVARPRPPDGAVRQTGLMSDGAGEPGTAAIAVVLEYVHLAVLNIDAEAGQVPPLLRDCADLLAACGVVADKTRLVITGDFVRSVQDRGEPGSTYHENYDTRRNTGMVGGKTIPRPDSMVDILLHAALFVPGDDEEYAAEIALRTLVHEAQHVVIAQNGEAGCDVESAPWARRNFLVSADQVIEEYRAESVACRVGGPNGWNTGDLVTTVRTWHEDLQRIALKEYQSHLDAAKLSYDILQETHTVWKLLAYVVAEQVAAGQALPASVVQDQLWALTVEPHWAEFTALLETVPGSDKRTPRTELDRLASELADVMERWLLTLGFEFSDTPEGPTFFITDWSVLTLQLD